MGYDADLVRRQIEDGAGYGGSTAEAKILAVVEYFQTNGIFPQGGSAGPAPAPAATTPAVGAQPAAPSFKVGDTVRTVEVVQDRISQGVPIGTVGTVSDVLNDYTAPYFMVNFQGGKRFAYKYDQLIKVDAGVAGAGAGAGAAANQMDGDFVVNNDFQMVTGNHIGTVNRMTIEQAKMECINLGAAGFTYNYRKTDSDGRFAIFFKSKSDAKPSGGWTTYVKKQ